MLAGYCINNLTLSEKGIKKLLEENNFKARCVLA